MVTVKQLEKIKNDMSDIKADYKIIEEHSIRVNNRMDALNKYYATILSKKIIKKVKVEDAKNKKSVGTRTRKHKKSKTV